MTKGTQEEAAEAAGNFDEFLGVKYFEGIQSACAVKSINRV